MDVSIIIVNYKTPDLVVDCVKSIKEKTVGLTYEVIVVDNASGDQSVPLMQSTLKDEIILIESEINLGFGKANNLGVKHASGKYVFLLNSDTLLINNAIKTLFDYLESHENVGVAGGNLYTLLERPSPSHCLSFDDIESVKAASRWSAIIGKIIGNRVLDKFLSAGQKERYYYKNTFNFSEKVKRVAYIFGTDMMLSRQLYESAGGFDPDFFMYAEEEEMCWRITEKGYHIVNVPFAKIIHYDGASVKRDDSFSERQYKMRMTGTFMYYLKRFGKSGVEDCCKYKMLQLDRGLKIKKIFRRTNHIELVNKQKAALQDVYAQFLKDQKLEAGGR